MDEGTLISRARCCILSQTTRRRLACSDVICAFFQAFCALPRTVGADSNYCITLVGEPARRALRRCGPATRRMTAPRKVPRIFITVEHFRAKASAQALL